MSKETNRLCGQFWRHEMRLTNDGYKRCIRCGTLPTYGVPLKVRFWDKVDKNGPVVKPELGQCWVWVAGNDRGYGRFGVGGKSLLATRVLWEWEIGPLSSKDFLCHKCDNPPCVRLEHLYKGASADNMRDMWMRGRACTNSISVEQVREIRKLSAMGLTTEEIAKRISAPKPLVYRAATGRTWKWVL